MTALIVIACIVGYMFVAVFTGEFVWRRSMRASDFNANDDAVAAAFAATFWPLAWLFIGASRLARWFEAWW